MMRISTIAALMLLAFGAPASAQFADCDALDPAHCLLPFPSDYFTVPDPATDTERRVNLPLLGMPRNVADLPGGIEIGVPIDPAEWNRNDGFSPGTPILAHVPGLDLHRTWGTENRPHAGTPNTPEYFDHRDHIADIGLYQRADAPIVLINTRTGKRHPFWSEMDTHPDTTDARRLLVVRPAVNLEHGTRYVVGLRRLKDAAGETIEPNAAFQAYRDGTATGDRVESMESIFAALGAAGIARDDLYLAWDFTVISRRNVSERVLHMRNTAFALLGDTTMADRIVQGSAPAFTVDSSEIIDEGEFGRFRRVQGTIEAPNFMTLPQGIADPLSLPAARLNYGADGMPAVNAAFPTATFTYTCDVPLDRGPSYPTLYGHGLVGSQSQIQDAQWPRRFGFLPCGADWWGMSTGDLPNIVTILVEMGRFPSLPDRGQQGFINFMYLGRAATHPQGFASHPCFQQNEDCATAGPSVVATATAGATPVFFDGNSQGGIMGAALVALSPDIQRGILGVPGINYSTLLNRSVDWEDAYGIPNYLAYRDPLERQINFGLIQMLWDRAEGNGYAHFLTGNPLPDTPPHEVMLQVSFSDHQVTNHAAEVMARTMGAPIMVPGLPAGRHWEMQPYFTPTATYPYRGSALIYWDSGNARPPNGNVPAEEGSDPHGRPRDEPGGGWQEANFLLTGEMVDVCNGGDYLTEAHPDAGVVVCPIPASPLGAFRAVGAVGGGSGLTAGSGGAAGAALLLLLAGLARLGLARRRSAWIAGPAGRGVLLLLSAQHRRRDNSRVNSRVPDSGAGGLGRPGVK